MSTDQKRYWVLDYETIINCTILCVEDYASEERHSFVINRHVNQLKEMLDFLKSNIETRSWHFTFNGLNFDAQITQYLIDNGSRLLSISNTEEITNDIYRFAQRVINSQNAIPKEKSPYPEWKIAIPQLDIFKLNHWDNKAKMSSLKWIQFSMDWHNVEEMPHPHYQMVEDDDTLNKLVSYCINDVKSTKAIFNYKDKDGKYPMKEQIKLRRDLSQTYNLNLYSASEPRISKEMFLHFLSERMGVDKNEIRNHKTLRPHVKIADVILPYIEFRDPHFKRMFEWFKQQVVEIPDDTEEVVDEKNDKGPKYTMIFRDVKTVFGLGGLHGCIKSGIYQTGNGFMIASVDVTSFYPNLAIRNKWGPAHLPREIFCSLYEWMFEERKKYPKGSTLNYLFKIILNATYGLSKNKHSFLYDPQLTFQITINGQLLLSMLYERICYAIPEALPLMQNTDGLEFMIPESAKPTFDRICKEWEEMTNLQLEGEEYSKLILADVNNYIGIFKNNKVKCKGRFEYKELALHKNKSFLVVPKALYEYFVNGVDPEEYLKQNQNIFDYCGGVKVRGKWTLRKRYLLKGDFHDEPLQKMVRYYISDTGVKLYKTNPDGRQLQIESGKWLQTVFNDAKNAEKIPFDAFAVNKSYYLEKIKQEISKIEKNSITKKITQYQLF